MSEFDADETLSLERVLAAWRSVLGVPGTWTIHKMMFGRVWSITTKSGHQFVLKQLADTEAAPRRARFIKETRIVIHLGGHGLPVAVPVLTDDGRICTEHGDALWALTPMLPMPDVIGLPTLERLSGEKPEYTPFGRAIADVHLALADCPYEIDGGTIDLDRFTHNWDRLHAGLAAETFETLHRRVDPLRPQIDAAVTGAQPQRLHGDCHGGNIWFREGRLAALVDIDHLQLGPRVYDLAYNLAFHLHWLVRLDAPQALAESSVSSAARLLLDGYQSVSALSEAERAAIAPMVLFVALELSSHFIGNAVEEEIWIRTACWIADHGHHVSA